MAQQFILNEDNGTHIEEESLGGDVLEESEIDSNTVIWAESIA